MRIREPKTTALIFASGKMVVTGAKSEDDSKLASRKYARIIQKLGFNAKFTDFKIQTPQGVAAARGTFYAVSVVHGKTFVSVDPGKVGLMARPLERALRPIVVGQRPAELAAEVSRRAAG